MQPKDFSNVEPKLVIEEYFNGTFQGTGIFFDRFGNQKRSFIVDLVCSTKDGVTYFDENLTYENGEKLSRVYTIKKISDNYYEATADGVEGIAKIDSFGNVLRWKYTLLQDINGSIWRLNFDDWMFLQPNGVVLNRAKAYKWGIFLGELFMSVTKIKS